jgi:hypothetical protein
VNDLNTIHDQMNLGQLTGQEHHATVEEHVQGAEYQANPMLKGDGEYQEDQEN